MAAENGADGVIVKEVHTFNLPAGQRLSGDAVNFMVIEDYQDWGANVSRYGSNFRIYFFLQPSSVTRRGHTHYYLLLEHKDRKEASCAFHGVADSHYEWDPSQSETEPRPTMDAICDPANGYVDEANQLTFKVLTEVSLGTGPAYRWMLPSNHTHDSPILSYSQVPLSTLWAQERNDLLEAMQNMFENYTSTDVTIETEGGGPFYAHKGILIAMSPVYQRGLEGRFGQAIRHNISITDFPAQAVKEFVFNTHFVE